MAARLRSTLEGGVWSVCATDGEAEALSSMARGLPWPHQPSILSIPALMRESRASSEDEVRILKDEFTTRELSFHHIIGRSVFNDPQKWNQRLNLLVDLLHHDGGSVTVAEPYVFGAQRLSTLAETLTNAEDDFSEDDFMAWRLSEDVAYQESDGHWNIESLRDHLSQAIESLSGRRLSSLKLQRERERKVRLSLVELINGAQAQRRPSRLLIKG